MYIDEVVVKLQAGSGGNGSASFRREKFVPKGGPDGGDGGHGGSVLVRANENTGDLRQFYFKPHWEAEDGGSGGGRQKHGRKGRDRVLAVPPGTQIYSGQTGELVAELLRHEEEVLLLQGGRGGWGNVHFKSSTNQAPRKANSGTPGESGNFRMELKTIADIGLVGFPNAGKSSLTGLITRAQPKTAAYPFTTLHPKVGVIEYPEAYERLLLADIPGLISGAHQNRGLGHRFLRHIERCPLLLLILDMAGTDGRSPLDDYTQLLEELAAYHPALLEKPRLIAANKMDEPNALENLREFQRQHDDEILPISCLSEEGIPVLKERLRILVQSHRGANEALPKESAST